MAENRPVRHASFPVGRDGRDGTAPSWLVSTGTKKATLEVAFFEQEKDGARYRVRTCDPYRVKVVLYR